MIDTEVTNVNRSLGTIFGSEITKKYDDTLDEDTFIIKCSGAGGQSFGAFIPKGTDTRTGGGDSTIISERDFPAES